MPPVYVQENWQLVTSWQNEHSDRKLTRNKDKSDFLKCVLLFYRHMHKHPQIFVVLSTGTAVGVVIYTGADTRSVMNTSKPRIKVGIVDLEINFLTKLLGIFLVFLVLLLIILQVRHHLIVCFEAYRSYWWDDRMTDTKLKNWKDFISLSINNFSKSSFHFRLFSFPKAKIVLEKIFSSWGLEMLLNSVLVYIW